MMRLTAAGREMKSDLTKASRLIISTGRHEQLRQKERNCGFDVLWR